MEDVANTIRLVGPFRCTVLITGETGTGKEMAARALHNASPRANLPMVAVNCSAVPETLLEAELFGHVKGAFTGATGHRIGRFEQAHKSTIFLDEISDMPLELQAKLLRVLQEREFQRLGSSETIQVDVRVIAASNVNLLERVKQGKFREDLYYRLNVVPLEMPPLRKRPDDIPLLAEHFVSKTCQAEGIPLKKLTPKTLERLSTMPWPGNVRQLENAVEKAIALSGLRDTLYPGDFGLAESQKLVAMGPVGPAPVLVTEHMDFAAAVSQFERSILQSALAKTGGNKTAAAELLGLKRTTLIMKLRGMGDGAVQTRQVAS
jgi:transcriptional regulator with GAF, ATPase, and Fis domain